jgi:hypothetical protein
VAPTVGRRSVVTLRRTASPKSDCASGFCGVISSTFQDLWSNMICQVAEANV